MVIFNLFKKYPSGFEGLFFTQAFFNFSFYGLKSLFVLYVIAQFSLSESKAISLFATLMALSYAASLIGGWIADKGLGVKSTIIVGGLFQALGIFLLIFPSEELFFLALSLICLGSGLFKPNLSSAVGMLFEDPKDPHKDNTYSAFYVAMNLGSFAGPLLCGFISKNYGGYYNGLFLIIVALIGGIWFFSAKIRFKQKISSPPFMNISYTHFAFIGAGLIGLLFVLYFLFKYHETFNHLMGAIALGSIIFLGKIFHQSNSQERTEILSIAFYILLFTFFCSLFEQVGSSLMIFFDKVVDRHILGIEIPSSSLLSLGSILTIICSPLLILFSEKIVEKKTKIDGLIKLSIGFLFTGLSFFILALGCTTENASVSLYWVIGALLIQTIGELLIVPIGFSNVSKLSPPRYRSLMMSFWLMAIAYGHYFAGFIAQFSLTDSSISENSLEHYHVFFLNLALMPCAVGCMLLIYQTLKRFRGLQKTRKIPIKQYEQ
ncbi:MAG: peptide MFS transporter [Thermodesulfobium sp.]